MTSLPEELLGELRALIEASRSVVRATPPDDPRRKAGDDLCRLASETLAKYDVSVHGLSLALGLSGGALRKRLAARGYIQTSPSQKSYVGTGKVNQPGMGSRPREACRKGHPMTPDNVYIRNSGARLCATCSSEASRRRYARKAAK